APVVDDLDPNPLQLGAGPDNHLTPGLAGFDGVGQQIHQDLVDLGRVATDQRQRAEVREEPDLPASGVALDNVDRRLDARVQIDLGDIPLIEPGEDAEVLDDVLDAPEALPSATKQSLQILQGVIDIDPVADLPD